MPLEADLLQPIAQRANLTVVSGLGRLGSRVAAELARLLQSAPEAHRRCVAVCDVTDSTASLSSATEALRSIENLDYLQARSYELTERDVGQPLRILLLFLVDLDDERSKPAAEKTLAQLNALNVTADRVGVLLTLGRAGDGNPALKWDLVLPFPAEDESGAKHTEDDLVATVARTIMVLTSPGQASLRQAVRASSAAAGSDAPPVLRAGGAFVDARDGELIRSLSARVAAELLRRQLADPKAHQLASTYDDGRKTTLESRVVPLGLAKALLSDTPFTLEGPEEGPWRLRLDSGETAIKMHGVPRARWIAVLRNLKNFFDFTKARRWSETLLKARDEIERALKKVMSKDVDALHRYPRAADRVPTWCAIARAQLERPFYIAVPETPDFDSASDSLRDAITRMPRPAPLWARVILLSLLVAGAAHMLVKARYGAIAGIGAAFAPLGTGALFGLWVMQAAYSRLLRARAVALQALCGNYEAKMRGNLAQALQQLRGALIAEIEAWEVDTRRLCAEAVACASKLEKEAASELSSSLSVDCALPPELEDEFLQSLSLPWERLLQDAAVSGALVPPADHNGRKRSVPLSSARIFALKYLESRQDDLGLLRQLEFRSGRQPGYIADLLASISRRSNSFRVRGGVGVAWFAPQPVLDFTRSQRQEIDSGAIEQPIELPVLACLRTSRPLFAAGGVR